MEVSGVKRFLRILANHCLVGIKPAGPGEPTLYFKVDTPLDVVADSLGIFGLIDFKRSEIEQRQQANKEAYPSSYQGIQGRR